MIKNEPIVIPVLVVSGGKIDYNLFPIMVVSVFKNDHIVIPYL